jgi:hypothetical protein
MLRELTDDRDPTRLLASNDPGRTVRVTKGGGVGVLVLLLGNEDPASEVSTVIAQKLAALGVTSVSVLRDERTTALALEGWAFDPDRSAEAAARVVVDDPATVRILRPVLESAVHTSPHPRSRGRST